MKPSGSHRAEIQGLRAIAVSLVLIFHLWPELLPGGYVGVDVFFVISGYLIVGSLARQAEREGRISLLDFYARRMRRLMPAATLVLAFVLAGTLLWLPQARWEDTFLQVAASALYVENWYLAWSSVDYLASENAPSPVQHYWSLSIEEQFYIVWPVMMCAILAVLRPFRLPLRQALGGLLFIVFAASFTASVLIGEAQSGAAYFTSHTRIWELALGGLLAIWLPAIKVGDGWRALLFSVGLALVVASGLMFDPAIVKFPGYAALLPTIGAGLVILAGDFSFGFFRGLNSAPLRYLGDISYSVYLWHWPLIVFYLANGNRIGLWDGLALVAVTLAVSHLSYVFVEEWFRHSDRTVENRTVVFGLASVAAIVGSACVAMLTLDKFTADLAAPASEAIVLYPGPAALFENANVPTGVPFKPAALQLLDDKATVYDSGCHQNQQSVEAKACEFGDPLGAKRIALVGSSHSVNWLPTLDVLGQKNGWKVVSITKSACSFSRSDSEPCNEWHESLLAYLKANPVDVVVIGEMSGSLVASDAVKELIAARWQKISDLGVPILAIRPTPVLATDPADCLPDRVELCVIPREKAIMADTIELASSRVPGVSVIDMNDLLCAKNTCSPVVGNLVVFRDKHHLTKTYALALAPYLETKIINAAEGLLPVSGTVFPKRDVAVEVGATLTCSALGSSPAFSRQVQPVLSGGVISLKRGDWQNETDGFEVWDGRIVNESVTISGRYIEGGTAVKTVEMLGTLSGGTVVAGGKRGPRSCSLVWATSE